MSMPTTIRIQIPFAILTKPEPRLPEAGLDLAMRGNASFSVKPTRGSPVSHPVEDGDEQNAPSSFATYRNHGSFRKRRSVLVLLPRADVSKTEGVVPADHEEVYLRKDLVKQDLSNSMLFDIGAPFAVEMSARRKN